MRYAFILLFSILAAQPLFEGITLEQFGVLPNSNQTVQPDARFNPNQPLRTNDYQSLQQIIATERQIVRMGAFYISQGPEGIGITLPANQTNIDESITTPIDNVRLILGANESTNLSRTTNNPTTQTFTLIYFLPGAAVPPTELTTANTITDYNVVGNAFHDVEYNALTPTITLDGSSIARVKIDEVVEQRIVPNVFLRPGRKFRLTLQNGQIFLLYVEQSQTPLALRVSSDATSLISLTSFTGFIRIAAIEATPPPAPTGFITPVISQPATWSTTIIQQTRPATPLSMFMLWPVDWTTLVGPQIRTFINQQFNVPSCALVADLLPVLARTDFSGANSLFNQLLAFGPTSFGDDTNSFLTFFNMVAARDLSGAITAYQTTPPISNPPCTAPFLPVPTSPFSVATIESTFDAHRTSIPIFADVEFSENLHKWTYTVTGDPNPLIIFPSWKNPQLSVCPTPPSLAILPIAGFGYADAIKGPLFGMTAFNNEIAFVEIAVPDWYNEDTIAQPIDLLQFFPDFFTIGSRDRGRLSLLFNQLPPQQVTSCELIGAPQTGTCDTSNLVTEVGKEVYKIALTAKTAAFVLNQSGQGLGRIRTRTEALINTVKTELTSWLQTHERNGFTLVDFFAGDSVTGGVCASQGMGASSEGTSSVDEGNAIYNNHHYQYGYWLAAVAFVVEWDQIFQTPNPWITLPVSNGIINKDLVDMLWRDARNPDKEDPQLPFNRHGNPWEGHSTQNGARYTVLSNGRLSERFAEDFHSWFATNLYARAIQLSDAVSPADKNNFDILATFSQTNLQMTAASAELVFQDSTWLYSGPYTVNLTVGTVTDATTEAATSLSAGTPCAVAAR